MRRKRCETLVKWAYYYIFSSYWAYTILKEANILPGFLEVMMKYKYLIPQATKEMKFSYIIQPRTLPQPLLHRPLRSLLRMRFAPRTLISAYLLQLPDKPVAGRYSRPVPPQPERDHFDDWPGICSTQLVALGTTKYQTRPFFIVLMRC
jgi:hypothetical protein